MLVSAVLTNVVHFFNKNTLHKNTLYNTLKTLYKNTEAQIIQKIKSNWIAMTRLDARMQKTFKGEIETWHTNE